MEGLEKLINAFGDVTVGRAALIVAALIFLAGCYSKISKYFGDKAINDSERDKAIKEVINQSKNYPKWRQQSIDIQESMNSQIRALSEKMDKLSKSSDEDMAYTWRYRILRFDDEIRHKIRHSKEHFDQILEDIDKYEKYCRENPDFPNNKAVFAVRNIRETYDKCGDEGTFL